MINTVLLYTSFITLDGHCHRYTDSTAALLHYTYDKYHPTRLALMCYTLVIIMYCTDYINDVWKSVYVTGFVIHIIIWFVRRHCHIEVIIEGMP